MEELEPQIAEWRAYVAEAPAVNGHDVDELEAHLRDQIAELDAGLTADEALLVAVKRMGDLSSLSREFAREHSRRALEAVRPRRLLRPPTGTRRAPVAVGGGPVRERRMDFVRFTGEWAIYYVLIALGGGVLTGLTTVHGVPHGTQHVPPARALWQTGYLPVFGVWAATVVVVLPPLFSFR